MSEAPSLLILSHLVDTPVIPGIACINWSNAGLGNWLIAFCKSKNTTPLLVPALTPPYSTIYEFPRWCSILVSVSTGRLFSLNSNMLVSGAIDIVIALRISSFQVIVTAEFVWSSKTPIITSTPNNSQLIFSGTPLYMCAMTLSASSSVILGGVAFSESLDVVSIRGTITFLFEALSVKVLIKRGNLYASEYWDTKKSQTSFFAASIVVDGKLENELQLHRLRYTTQCKSGTEIFWQQHIR
ncbi:unnamed protein product [Albugo candida]|uniref:Uncharacterized protein n=1 Tax=Albugo candida TaxID=65357 RepID=A0A024FX47_9STRA|nr:unnamed protein product [Albugo candida]|eukprot:CCI11758.1 unnamed protein product [Albugo candida]